MSSSKIVLKIVSFCFSILLITLLAFGLYRGGQGAYRFGYRVFTEPAVDMPEEGEEKLVQVSANMDAAELGSLLEKKGLIRSAGLFVLQLRLSSYFGEIQEGSYTLSTSMTAHEMMQVMSAEECEDGTEEE